MANNVKCITDLNVSFELDGKTYYFNVADMNRNTTDGGGNPIFSEVAYEKDTGRRCVVNLGSDWTVRNLFMDTGFNLRSKIADGKEWHLKKYGELNWHWYDEGLPNAILDYHSSIGSTEDFTAADWRVCKENGWTRAEVEELCKDD